VWVTASPSRSPRVGSALFAVWVAVLTFATWALFCFPSSEPLALELVVFSFALLYGFGVWPVVPTVLSIVAFGVLSAFVMYPREEAGDLPPALLVEVVAPLVLACVVIYHVRRREDAVRRAGLLADANRRRAVARERLSRMTSHELRTPLTIATGYVDQLLVDESAEGRRADLRTVRDELVQLARVSERLVRAVALDLGAPDESTSAGALLRDVRRRWNVVVDRELVVTCEVDTVPVNAHRLRAALDTLVENSLRYTAPGDRIHLFCRAVPGAVRIGVADSGSGISQEMLERINAGADLFGDGDEEGDAVSGRLRDSYSQTGFGLRLVAGIAQAAGGHLVAGRSPYGGAQVAIVVPTQQ